MFSPELPLLTKNLCSRYLELVKNDPVHSLDSSDCIEIFKSFGPSSVAEKIHSGDGNQDWYYWPVNLSFADRVYGWLAVITARKVLPIWEQFGTGEIGDEHYSHDPETMLKTAEDFLLGLADTVKAKIDLCNRFYFGMAGLEYQTNKQGWFASGAAYRALEAIFNGIESPTADYFVMEVAGAFSIIDSNPPGLWFEAYRLEEVKEAVAELTAQKKFEDIERLGYYGLTEELAERVKDFVPVQIDTAKQLEFWEWWLTEAIPQAWQLAHHSSSQPKSL